MTIEQLRKAVKSERFQPFTISLADGRRLRVPHPEFIWIPPEASRTFHAAGKGEDLAWWICSSSLRLTSATGPMLAVAAAAGCDRGLEVRSFGWRPPSLKAIIFA
jgi:hypothetical protein